MNFKKYIAIGSLAVLGLIGCGSAQQPVAVNSPPPPPAVAPAPVAPPVAAPVAPAVDPLVMSGEHFSLKLPDDSWAQMEAPDDSVLALAQNADLKARLMLLGETTPLNTDAFAKTVLASITKTGVKVLNKPTKVSINGNEFVYADVLMAKAHVYMWITVKDGMSYGLMCGGAADSSANIKNTCSTIANTFQIK